MRIEMRHPDHPGPLYWGFSSITDNPDYARVYHPEAKPGIALALANLLVCYPDWELVVSIARRS